MRPGGGCRVELEGAVRRLHPLVEGVGDAWIDDGLDLGAALARPIQHRLATARSLHGVLPGEYRAHPARPGPVASSALGVEAAVGVGEIDRLDLVHGPLKAAVA